jgi:hypothetical protein
MSYLLDSYVLVVGGCFYLKNCFLYGGFSFPVGGPPCLCYHVGAFTL